MAKKKNPPSRPLGMVIKVKPQAKKAKVESRNEKETANICGGKEDGGVEKVDRGSMSVAPSTGLVSYSDSDDDSKDDD